MAANPPTWSPRLPAEGAAFPDDLVDLLWDYFEWDRCHAGAEWARPRSRQQLRTLVHHAYQAGMREDERRPVRFQVLFDLAPSQVTLPFSRPQGYGVADLVKLAPTIGIGDRWLVVAPPTPDADELRIHGICDPHLSPHSTALGMLTRWAGGMGLHIPDVTGITVAVLGPGWVRVATWAQRVFELRDCHIRLPITLHDLEPVSGWYQEVAERLDLADTTLGTALVRRIWGGIVSRVRDQRHGGCLVVVPDHVAPDRLPLAFNYPVGSGRLQEVVLARMRLEPGLAGHVHGEPDLPLADLDDAHFRERDVVRAVDLFGALAAVDGAVVVARDLCLLGFGAEFVNLAPRAPEESVPCLLPAPGERRLASFGMRHRSAYRFCQNVGGSMAFVISQDGDVRLFAPAGGAVALYEAAIPEDQVVATVGVTAATP
jgi:hypothetical protein